MKQNPIPLELIGRDGAWYVRFETRRNRQSAVGEFAGQQIFGRPVYWSAPEKITVQVVGDLKQACDAGTCLMLLEQLCSGYKN